MPAGVIKAKHKMEGKSEEDESKEHLSGSQKGEIQVQGDEVIKDVGKGEKRSNLLRFFIDGLNKGK